MNKNPKYETCQNGDIKSNWEKKVKILSLYLFISSLFYKSKLHKKSLFLIMWQKQASIVNKYGLYK